MTRSGLSCSQGRVLLVTSNFPRWEGDSTTPFVLHLVQDLQEAGWTVDVLAPHFPGAAKKETLEGVAVERFVYAYPESRQTLCYQGGALINLRSNFGNFLKVPGFLAAQWVAIKRKLKDHSYDIVNSHWILPQGFTAALVAKQTGLPHVTTVHGGDVFALKGRVMNRFKRYALQQANAVTVNSSATESAVKKLAPEQARVLRVPMGVSECVPDERAVNLIRGKFGRKDTPLLIFVGRLVEEKGLGDLIDAVDCLRKREFVVDVLVLGEGQDRQIFEDRAARLGLSDQFRFLGWISPLQVVDYLAAADVFIGPSRRSSQGWVEAQGLTFAESMLAGTPVIATNCGGIPDLVRHGETGLLVEEGSAEQIASAIMDLHGDRQLANRLVTSAKSMVKARYTRRASAKAFGDVFSQTLAERT